MTRDPPPELAEICDYYRPYYHLIYLLAKRMDGLFVETGVEKGRGCGSALLGGMKAVGVDHTRHAEKIGGLEARFDGFTFLEQDSLPVPGWFTEDKKIAILHIDTEHSYSQAREEFKGYAPFLEEGAVVLFDDLHAQNDGVGKFFWKLPYPKIQDDRLHEVGYGALVFHKGEEVPE